MLFNDIPCSTIHSCDAVTKKKLNEDGVPVQVFTAPCKICYALVNGKSWTSRDEEGNEEEGDTDYEDSAEDEPEFENPLDFHGFHDLQEVKALGHVDQIYPDSSELPPADEMDDAILGIFIDHDFYKPLAKHYMNILAGSPNCWPSLKRLVEKGKKEIAANQAPPLGLGLQPNHYHGRFLEHFLKYAAADFLPTICGE